MTKDNIPNTNPKVDHLCSFFKKEGLWIVISGLCDNVAHVQFVRLRVLKTHICRHVSQPLRDDIWAVFGRAFGAFRCIELAGLMGPAQVIYRNVSLSAAWTLRLFATACVIVIFILLILFVVVRVVLQRPQTRRGSVALIRASHFASRKSEEVAQR